jgi:hypothetical protein
MFVERTHRELMRLMSRPLSDLRLAVIMLDGIELHGYTLEPGNVRLLGFHARVCENQERTVQGQADHEQEEDAGQAAERQKRAAQTHASPNPRTRTLAGQGP